MAWSLGVVASLFEVAFALSMKASFGFTRLIPSAIAVITGIASVVILSQALRTLPVGTGGCRLDRHRRRGIRGAGDRLLQRITGPAATAHIGLVVAGIIGLRLTTNTAG